MARRVTLLVTVRATPLLAWEKAGRVKFNELISADFKNQVLIVFVLEKRLELL